MAKYVNLDKLANIFEESYRQQINIILEQHPEIVVDIDMEKLLEEEFEEDGKPQTNPLIGRSVMTKRDNEVHIVTNVITFEEDTFGQGNFAVETSDGLYLYECEIEILTNSQLK